MLVDTLEKQLALHKSLLQLAQLKTDAVKKGDMDELNRIVREEQKHVGAITILEKRRASESDETVSELLPSLPQEEQVRAEAVRDELIDVLSQLKEVNELNVQLVEQSLQFVHLQLDLLAPADSGTYAADGDNEGPASGPLFDSKA
ncbi:flagellar protein FlgN [Domibacillus aminovorans]|uniref:Flagellar biosynthesis protein FlgN n=1 Tax=Domibacillus aminovorans TaxID=29332 RepID=A0A177L1C8_9BACI|nr:flagellar protein FlgN [Domibacillus aminovorans]OAH59075.1 hypothetical protein AWH49_05285 [Domibacillus aminovorans]